MAEARLNFDEGKLDKQSSLYDLYSRLYQGMDEASKVDAPSFETPPTTPEGDIDTAAISQALKDYSTILTKNSAYLFANSIVSAIGSGGGGGVAPGSGYVSRSGDSMTGNLNALYGFSAGLDNAIIFSVSKDLHNNYWANITGNERISGELHLSDSGIFFRDKKNIYYQDDKLVLENAAMSFIGNIGVTGEISVGNTKINDKGFFFGENEYYHSGNSNKVDVDWTMQNGLVDKALTVNGLFQSNGGFEFFVDQIKILHSGEDVVESPGALPLKNQYIFLNADLKIAGSKGIKFRDKYVLKTKVDRISTVSLSAPDMILNLGDSDAGLDTRYVALKSGLRNHDGTVTMVSQFGDGNFPNSFKAGCSLSGPTVLSTFYSNKIHNGIIAHEELRFNDTDGVMLRGEGLNLVGEMNYARVQNDNEVLKPIKFGIEYKDTTSLFRDISKEWSATLNFNTDAEFFAFGKPVEAVSFSIKTERYKTRLIENTLFFADEVYLEGIPGGIHHQGDATFSGSLSSTRFASGFAGYGWAIKENEMFGGIAATFDELTIRKKMRVYELEVQKISVTNGSLWVSDSCSGDEVRPLL